MGFFNSLLGKDQSRGIDRASAQAMGHLNQGYDSAGANTRTGMAEAQGYYQPYAQQGQQAQTMYGNALGLNGADAQQKFQQGYGGDPFRRQNEDYTTNALMRSYNARGMGGGGTAAMAAARANLQRGSQDYNQYLDRLGGQAGMGLQVAGAQAGIATNGYNALAGYDVARGQGLASNTINAANAKAQAQSAGVNNVLGIVGGIGKLALGSNFSFGGGGKSGGDGNDAGGRYVQGADGAWSLMGG